MQSKGEQWWRKVEGTRSIVAGATWIICHSRLVRLSKLLSSVWPPSSVRRSKTKLLKVFFAPTRDYRARFVKLIDNKQKKKNYTNRKFRNLIETTTAGLWWFQGPRHQFLKYHLLRYCAGRPDFEIIWGKVQLFFANTTWQVATVMFFEYSGNLEQWVKSDFMTFFFWLCYMSFPFLHPSIFPKSKKTIWDKVERTRNLTTI